MKKFYFIIPIALLIMMISTLIAIVIYIPKPNYDTQTITLENSGTFKVPNEWKYYKKDNRIYFVDANEQPIMIQHHSYANFSETIDAQPGEKEINQFFEIQALELLESEIFSNCGTLCKTKWLINGSETKKYEIEFSYGTEYSFIVLDDSLSKKDLKIIVNSYEHF